MFGEKRRDRYLCDQMRQSDAARPCPRGITGPLPAVGNPKSLSDWLQKEADISCGEKGKLLSGDWGHTGLRTEILWGVMELAKPQPEASTGLSGQGRSWAACLLFPAKSMRLVKWPLSRFWESGMCPSIGHL